MHRSLVLTLLGALIPLPAFAQEKPTAQPATTPPPVVGNALENATLKVLPEVTFIDKSLDDVVAFLHGVHPPFQAVIIRDPDVPADYPTVRELRLKNVSISQVLQILQHTFPIDVDTVGEDAPPVHVLRVHNPAGDGTKFNVAAPAPAVHVFRLADAVDAQVRWAGKDAQDKAARKEGANQVLSAITAALELQSPRANGPAAGGPKVQVHEETLTLLLKGTPEHAAVIRKLLDALEPPAEHAVVATLKQQVAELKDRRTEQLGRAEGEKAGIMAQYQQALEQLRAQQAELLKLRAELEKLRLRQELDRQKAKAASTATPPAAAARTPAAPRPAAEPKE